MACSPATGQNQMQRDAANRDGREFFNSIFRLGMPQPDGNVLSSYLIGG